jgi:gamma-glutamyltranspeptidase / glutathione hydrolase
MCWQRCIALLVIATGALFVSKSSYSVPTDLKPAHSAIASAHPMATQAGLDMLAAGGNAFDAAVAVSAVLSVVEPASSGVGGGGFYLLHVAANGRDVMLDGRETAPQAATRDMYLNKEGKPVTEASKDGPLAAGIPGTPAAWAWLAARYGRLPLTQSMAPAIRIARAGFPLYERLANAMRVKQARLAASPDAAAVFLVKGQVPQIGFLIRQPALARTLTLIASSKAESFYQGALAARLVNGVRHDGGIWAMSDLTAYRIIEREPIRFQYHGAHVVSAPPPSAGGLVMADALAILAGYDLSRANVTTRRHLLIEALRHGYRDRAEYLGDPDFVSIPTEQLLSPWYAAGQRTSIRVDRATPSADLRSADTSVESTSTTHFSILDREGNQVAATQSVNLFFGATYMIPGTGILLNDTMDDFSVAAGVPNAYGLVGAEANAIAPGKRPLSSMTPTFVESDQGLLITGSPGGSTIITNVLGGVLGWLDGQSAAQIVAAPRLHHQYMPDTVSYETGALTLAERGALEGLGHVLIESKAKWGNTQAVTWNFATGAIEAASDPRGFGAGLVY